VASGACAQSRKLCCSEKRIEIKIEIERETLASALAANFHKKTPITHFVILLQTLIHSSSGTTGITTTPVKAKRKPRTKHNTGLVLEDEANRLADSNV
jgi:hypothetical protein